MTAVLEVVLDRSLCSGALLERLEVPETGHGTFSSSEGPMGIFGRVVEPATTYLTILHQISFIAAR